MRYVQLKTLFGLGIETLQQSPAAQQECQLLAFQVSPNHRSYQQIEPVTAAGIVTWKLQSSKIALLCFATLAEQSAVFSSGVQYISLGLVPSETARPGGHGSQ